MYFSSNGDRLDWRVVILGLAFAAVPFNVLAVDPAGGPARDHDRFELSPLLVTASPAPKIADDYNTLVSALDGRDRLDIGASNLAGGLTILAGVQQTGFAPGAGRPVIRGFRGPRVQILQDGLGVADLSAMSDDHAVSEGAMLARRVEVLRGPSTLLYGGNAIGGVVNVIDETAPTDPQQAPVSGEAAMTYHGASDGWQGGARATVNEGPFAIRVSALRQRLGDYRVPSGFVPEEGAHADHDHHHDDDHDHDHDDHHDEDPHGKGSDNASRRLADTFSERDRFSLGASWFSRGGARVSLWVEHLDADYGVPGHVHAHDEGHHHELPDESSHGEEVVTIDLRSRRLGGIVDLPLEGGFLLRSRLSAVYSDYRHAELEVYDPVTWFSRDALEVRNDWTHAEVAGFDGLFGVQLLNDSSRSRGLETLTPPTDTRQAGVFWLIEQADKSRSVTWQHGARLEHQSVRAEGEATYRGWAGSASSGARWRINQTDALHLQGSVSQRHPSSSELFADGPHLATGRFEIGDPGMDTETAVGVDLTYRKKIERLDLSAAVFAYRFYDYIYERPTGDERQNLPEFRYDQADARIHGIDLEATFHLVEGPDVRAHVTVGGDYARLKALAEKEALPRNPPARARTSFHLERGRMSADFTVWRVFEQNYIATYETPTSAYTMLDVVLAWRFDLGVGQGRLFLRGDNLTDEVAFNHLAADKHSKPLPGRSLSAGFHFTF